MDFSDKVGYVWTGIFFGIIWCIFWRYILITAFRESRLQGLLCIFPLYAIYYVIKILKRSHSELKSVITGFMEAGTARNVEAAYACWSPQCATKEEITELIKSSYDDVFAGYKRLTIDHGTISGDTEGEVGGTIIYTSSSGAIIHTGGKRLPFKAWLVKENDVWKTTGIQIGSTETGKVTRVSTDIEAGPVNRNS